MASFPQTDEDVWIVSTFPLIINFTFLAESLFYREKKRRSRGKDIPSEFAGNNLVN